MSKKPQVRRPSTNRTVDSHFTVRRASQQFTTVSFEEPTVIGHLLGSPRLRIEPNYLLFVKPKSLFLQRKVQTLRSL